MLFSYTKVTVLGALVTSALAAPWSSTSVPPPKRNASIAGALYVATNAPWGNEIMVSSLDFNGKATFSHAVPTGGQGGGNGGPGVTHDTLDSQDSVVVQGDYLFVVNAGSSDISMFYIDPIIPTRLAQVGTPVASGGDFPIAIAVKKDNSMACVINGGTYSGVNCFNINVWTGLSPIKDSFRYLFINQTTPISGPANTFSDILFSEKEDFLYVTLKGTPMVKLGSLLSFAVYGGSIAETPVVNTPTTAAALPFSMTLIPNSDSVFTTDPGVGVQIYTFDKNGNATISPFTIPGQGASCWSERSPSTGSYYVSDTAANTIVEIGLSESLAPSILSNTSIGSGLIDETIATINGKDYLYVISAFETTIYSYALPSPGQVVLHQNFTIGAALNATGQPLTSYMQGIAMKLSS